jgi:hypothetical protein
VSTILFVALAVLAIVFLVLALARVGNQMYFLVAAVVCAVLLVLLVVFTRASPAGAVAAPLVALVVGRAVRAQG